MELKPKMALPRYTAAFRLPELKNSLMAFSMAAIALCKGKVGVKVEV